MIALPPRRFIATAHPPYFIDANRLRPHRGLSNCPSSPNLHPLQESSHVSNFSACQPNFSIWPFIYFRSSPMEKRKACIQYRHSSRMRERKPSKRLFLSEAASSCEGFTRDFPHDGGWPIQPSLRVGRQGVSFKHRADMPETEQHSHWK